MLGRTAGAVLVGVEARLVERRGPSRRRPPQHRRGGLGEQQRSRRDRSHPGRAHALRDSSCRSAASRSISPRPTCARTGARSICPIAAAILAADGRLGSAPRARRRLGGRACARRSGAAGAGRSGDRARGARAAAARGLLVPAANVAEALLVPGIQVWRAGSLADAIALLKDPRRDRGRDRGAAAAERAAGASSRRGPGRSPRPARRAPRPRGGRRRRTPPPADRAPGSGKTMLARRLPGILPPLSHEEALEVTRAWSAAGLASGLVRRRPFRAPHHGVSLAGLIGGGQALRPGEIALANGGVLYLDELTEFRRDALEALRQPLESGDVSIVRLHARAVFPRRFMLVASMNPCPCGWHGDPRSRCRCTPNEVRRYQAKLSGPLLDRFDLAVEVPAVDPGDLAAAVAGEASGRVRDRVQAARVAAAVPFRAAGSCIERAHGTSGARASRRARSRATTRILVDACRRLGLTARGFDRVRRGRANARRSRLEPRRSASATWPKRCSTDGWWVWADRAGLQVDRAAPKA